MSVEATTIRNGGAGGDSSERVEEAGVDAARLHGDVGTLVPDASSCARMVSPTATMGDGSRQTKVERLEWKAAHGA